MSVPLVEAVDAIAVCDHKGCEHRAKWAILCRCCRVPIIACETHARTTRQHHAHLPVVKCPFCQATGTPDGLIEWTRL